MKWRPIKLTKRQQDYVAWATAPIWGPAVLILAIWLSPIALWAYLDAKWKARQIARGRHVWFAWRPVKFDAFWYDEIDSCWFWFERVERRWNRRRWEYLPVGFDDPYEPREAPNV